MSSTNTGQSNGLGAKIKGGIQAIHGLGENIRGTALGALDAMSEGHETQNDEIARRGRVETEAGLAKWKGQPAPAYNTAGGGPGYQAGTTNPAQASGTSDTTTNPQSAGAGLATNEARRDGLAKVNGQPTNPATNKQALGNEFHGGDQYNHQQVGMNPAQASAPADTTGPNTPSSATDAGNIPGVPSKDSGGGYPQHHRDDAISNDPDAIQVGQQNQQGNVSGPTSGFGQRGPNGNAYDPQGSTGNQSHQTPFHETAKQQQNSNTGGAGYGAGQGLDPTPYAARQ